MHMCLQITWDPTLQQKVTIWLSFVEIAPHSCTNFPLNKCNLINFPLCYSYHAAEFFIRGSANQANKFKIGRTCAPTKA